MRDIFEDIFRNRLFDPNEAARRAMRPQLRRRFYDDVSTVDEGRAFALRLDDRPVRTPARRALAAPTRPLAEALAQEWRAQKDVIDPSTMPLTRLANSIIDGVADAAAPVAADVAKYLGSDLVFYRADAPERLVERQALLWDPVIDFAREVLGARFVLAQGGLVFAQQPEAALAAARAAIPHDPWRLGAVHSITTLTGSALIALAVAAGKLSIDDAWTAAHVDEDWNMETWGRDELALERRAFRFAEMQAAGRVLELTAR